MKEKVVIYGAGSQGKIIADILNLNNEYDLFAYIDDSEHGANKDENSIQILRGSHHLLDCFNRGIKNIIIGIGNNIARQQIANKAQDLGLSLVSAIHRSAVIASDVQIGSGTVIKALAVIEPGAIIGENVIIGAQAYIGHEVIIADFAHISGGVRIGGKTIIGKGAIMGIGSIIKDKINIGENAKVGAGSVVLEDIPKNYVAFGVPARLLWERNVWKDD